MNLQTEAEKFWKEETGAEPNRMTKLLEKFAKKMLDKPTPSNEKLLDQIEKLQTENQGLKNAVHRESDPELKKQIKALEFALGRRVKRDYKKMEQEIN